MLQRAAAAEAPSGFSGQPRPPSHPAGLFQKGVAISVWQNSSDEASQWTAFMKRKHYFGQKHLVAAFQESNDFWNRYEDDIQLVKALGCNSFRFSFEWARIEPAPGQIDVTAITRYHKILDSIEAAGLLPNATLHHFTHPQWFEERGGFANSDNIAAFISYSVLMFKEFGGRVPFWATFNEPSCFGLCGYIMGLWAPGQKGRVGKAGRVLANILKAHVAVYRRLKAMPHGETAQIGIVHQHIRFVPHCNWLASLIVRPVCYWMTYWFAERQMLDFFTTARTAEDKLRALPQSMPTSTRNNSTSKSHIIPGRFTWHVPLRGKVIDFVEPAAVGAMDWWGINYYSRPAISSAFKLVGTGPAEPLTGMGMPLVAGDMYKHLMQAYRGLQVPIIVSETGVSDQRHVLRARCISSYYNEVLRALADGCDVRGVYYWTLMDNIEWHHGFRQHFGLYEWRPAGAGGPGRPTDGSALQLRQGSKALVALHTAWPERWDEMREFAQQKFGPASAAAAAGTGLGPQPLEQIAGAGAGVEGFRPRAGDGNGEHSSVLGRLTGVHKEYVDDLEQEVLAADTVKQQNSGDVEQPLLGGGGRITDAL